MPVHGAKGLDQKRAGSMLELVSHHCQGNINPESLSKNVFWHFEMAPVFAKENRFWLFTVKFFENYQFSSKIGIFPENHLIKEVLLFPPFSE